MTVGGELQAFIDTFEKDDGEVLILHGPDGLDYRIAHTNDGRGLELRYDDELMQINLNTCCASCTIMPLYILARNHYNALATIDCKRQLRSKPRWAD